MQIKEIKMKHLDNNKCRSIERLIGTVLTVMLFTAAFSLGAHALDDGTTVEFNVNTSHNDDAGFVVFKLDDYDYLKGSCIQKGTPYSKSGKAKMSSKSNSSNLAKAAYYVDVEKGWFGNSKDRPSIMDEAGVASRFKAGLLAEDIVQCANQGTEKWSSIALNQTYPEKYVKYVCDLVEKTIPDVKVPDNFVIYKGSPNDDSQDFAVWGYSPTGKLKLKKISSNTGISG